MFSFPSFILTAPSFLLFLSPTVFSPTRAMLSPAQEMHFHPERMGMVDLSSANHGKELLASMMRKGFAPISSSGEFIASRESLSRSAAGSMRYVHPRCCCVLGLTKYRRCRYQRSKVLTRRVRARLLLAGARVCTRCIWRALRHTHAGLTAAPRLAPITTMPTHRGPRRP